jgi:hypothetical protein
MKTIKLDKKSTIIFTATQDFKGKFSTFQSFLDVKKFMEDYKIEKCRLIIANFEIDVIHSMTPERFWQIFQTWCRSNVLTKEKIIDFASL